MEASRPVGDAMSSGSQQRPPHQASSYSNGESSSSGREGKRPLQYEIYSSHFVPQQQQQFVHLQKDPSMGEEFLRLKQRSYGSLLEAVVRASYRPSVHPVSPLRVVVFNHITFRSAFP
eukprot:7193478-Pyramimonas_sp.AAC.1